MTEQTKTFQRIVVSDFPTLDLYTTAITRAHGKSHPEAFEVRELFETMKRKAAESGEEKPELDAEFARLRSVTNHYRIPEDVCETYAAVYEMLSKADEIYYAQ